MSILLILLCSLIGTATAFYPLNSSALLVALGLLAVGFMKPALLIFLSLSLGAIDLSWITGREKILFPSLGGIDFNGLKLITLTSGLFVFGILKGYFKNPRLKIYLVFLLLCLFSLFYSAAPLTGLRTFFKLSLPYLFFLVIRHQSHNPAFTNSLEKSIYAAIFIFSLISFVMLATGWGFNVAPGQEWTEEGARMYQMRFSGPTGNWAGTASFTALLGLFLYSKFLLQKKWLFLIPFFFFLFLLFLTLSRTEIGAFAIAFCMMNFLLKKRALALLAILAILFTALAYTPIRNKLFLSEKNSISESLTLEAFSEIQDTGRLVAWAYTVSFFLKNPIFGNGLGNTEKLLGIEENDTGYVPHNEYLRLSSDVGLLGTSLFLTSYLALTFLCWRRFKNGDRKEQIDATLGIASILFYLLICVTDNGIDWYSSATQFVWVFVALALFSQCQTQKQPKSP